MLIFENVNIMRDSVIIGFPIIIFLEFLAFYQILNHIKTRFTTILIKFQGLYHVLLCRVLLGPFIYISMNIYTCTGFENCFNVIHILFLIFGILFQFVNLILFFLHMIILRDNNPMSSIVWSAYDGLFFEITHILLMIVAIIFSLGIYFDTLNQLSIIICILGILTIILRLKDGGDHKNWMNIFSVIQESLCVTLHMGSFILYFYDFSISIVFISLISTIPIVYFCEIYKKYNEKRIMITSLASKLNTTNDIEIYIKKFIECINHPENNQDYMTMTSILIFHRRHCGDTNCVCHKLKHFINEKYNSSDDIEIRAKNTKISILNSFIPKYIESKPLWSKLLISIIQESFSKFPRESSIYLQLSYIFTGLLNNYYMALYYIQNAKANSNSLLLEFCAFRQIYLIESLLSNEIKKIFRQEQIFFNKCR